MPDPRDARVSLAGLGNLIGVATSGVSNNSAVVDIGGISVVARVVVGVTFASGDAVMITRVGSQYYVNGVVAQGPAVPPAPEDPPEAPPDRGDPAPAPKPPSTTGTLTCHPVATATYRDGKWRTDIGSVNYADTYQGRYGGSGFGRNTGCAFYGSKPRSIAGATVTKATVRLRRLVAGDYARRTPTMRLVSQSTRPSGAPTLNETISGPALGVVGKVSPWETTFVLPDSWAQAMVNGTRGGLAISIGSDSPYIRLAGRGSFSAAWVMVIYWRKG